MAGGCEYPSPAKLSGISRRFFKIPKSIICDNGVGDKLVTAFSFFSVRKGLDDKAMFSLNGVVEWSGRKPNRCSSGANAKFEKAIAHLERSGWLSLDDGLSNTRCCTARVNMRKVDDECDSGYFAIVYLDELEKMLGWTNPNPKDTLVTSDILLRVFACIRMLIRRRPNKVPPDDDVERRRLRWPEAWSGYYRDIGDDLGISARVVSVAVDALCEIGLLYSEALPRTRVNGRWVTNHTVFCNAYKREGQCLLASGEEYYMREIENKKRMLNLIGNGGA